MYTQKTTLKMFVSFMRTQLNSIPKTIALVGSLAALMLASRADAQFVTNNYVYNGNQGSSPGTNWYGTGVTAYWKTNLQQTANYSQPTNGTATATTTNYNIYTLTNNGTAVGNATTTTLIRDPFTSPFYNVVTFPGDSLILGTNTQLRFKHGGSGPNYVANVPLNIPTNNFPGNFGLPGLVLDGGVLNGGDSGFAWVIMGTLYAVPGSTSYLLPADTLAGDAVQRGLIINSRLSGSGNIVLLNATNNVPLAVQGTSNIFTGTWVVRAGCLQGMGDGTNDGYNSLGTNGACNIIIDPNWVVPNTFASGSVFWSGPAILDMGPSLANCGGTLVLTNGGQMYLHGNVIFSKVNIDTVSLPNGTYTYAYLTNTFTTANGYAANYFTPTGFANGSGTLTVQPYGAAVIPPLVTLQPSPEILYPGRTAVFISAGNDLGKAPLYYQWLKNGAVLNNGATGSGSVVSGATSTNLNISLVSTADDGGYSLLISNVIGTITSSVAPLTIVSPVEAYETAVTNLNPIAFYQFNEITNTAAGTAEAFDYAGGFNGTYGNNVQNGYNGIAGPTAATSFPGFVSTNSAASFTYGAAGGQVTVPSWNLNTNTVTLCCWINPSQTEANSAGVIYCRGADTVAGLSYCNVINPVTTTYDLGYNWNNDQSVYNWDSGLVAPLNQWSFVALVVTPTAATIYLMNTNGLTSSTHVYAHVVQPFSSADTTMIGDDSFDGGNGTRTFAGQIDDVAVFNTALTSAQVANLFYVATGVTQYAPVIGVQPVSTNAYTGQTISFSVGADASLPFGYQWAAGVTGSGGPYTPLSNGLGANGETISGAQSATLTIQNVALADALDYVVVITNGALNGSVTSSVATLTVTAASAMQNITMSEQEASGADWNTVGAWSDNNPASVSAVEEPGSTYRIAPGQPHALAR